MIHIQITNPLVLIKSKNEKRSKEYIQEILNEIIFSNEKPTQAQVRRLIIAIEKIKNTPQNRTFLDGVLKKLYHWFTVDD